MSSVQDFKSEFGPPLLKDLAARFAAVHPGYDPRPLNQLAAEIDQLPMKERVRQISATLRASLPAAFPTALGAVLAAFRRVPPLGRPALRGFTVWPALQFVEDFGLEHLDQSLAAMHELTQRFSAEFAIRPFILAYPAQVMDTLRLWARDPSPDVRRLVSEGTRPRLPWGRRLKPFLVDPTPVIELLELLVDDESEYVRRSVANNLNDISKDHPDRVVEVLLRWQPSRPDDRDHQRLCRHACRTLIKAGHQGALSLLGFGGVPAVDVQRFTVSPGAIQLGDSILLECELKSIAEGSQRLAIDYAITFARARGKRGRKVFKLAQRELPTAGVIALKRRHAVVPVSVRNYYSGSHEVELLINGVPLARARFELQC